MAKFERNKAYQHSKQVATATQGQVDLSQQPRGMYLLQVSAANGQTSTFKVIR